MLFEIGFFIISLGILFFCGCAGVSFLRENRGPTRIVETVHNPKDVPEVRKAPLKEQLIEIQTKKFGIPMMLSSQQNDDFELREPENEYKGPYRRTNNINRSAKPRRYYDRRQDPELLGRRGLTNKETREKGLINNGKKNE